MPPEITDWSTQDDVVRNRALSKAGPKQMTSEEIHDYWESQKDVKHWRSTAALRGYNTRTDDEVKLAAWAKTSIAASI